MIEVVEDPKFTAWLSRLKDRQAKARIAGRIQRLAYSLAGDVQPVGEGVSEASQDRDIKAAKVLATNWKLVSP